MTEFLAKSYINRDDLESAIKIETGTDIEANKLAGNLIKGTRKELKRLQLTDICVVFGCRVIITDSPTSELLAEKIKKPIK